MNAKKAVILLGGKGTRLSALFPDLPKALVPVAGRPFLAWQLNWLFSCNFKRILLAACYKGGQIQNWIGQQPFKNMVNISIEPSLLGTGGAVKYALKSSEKKSFWVFNGDSLLPEMNFQGMEEAHRRSGAPGTIAVTRIEDSARYGTVAFDDNGKIINFNEKGKSGAGWINAGIYLFEPAILSDISPDKNVSIESEIFPKLAARGKLFAFQAKPPLLDMGTPEGLQKMETYLRRRNA